MAADTIIHNARIATNTTPSFVEAIAITAGKISATGTSDKILRQEKGPATRVIDANGRTVIPGLNDSHMHPIREGLNYTMELRWDGVPSLADALRMLKDQAQRTPPPPSLFSTWTTEHSSTGRLFGPWATRRTLGTRQPVRLYATRKATQPVF